MHETNKNVNPPGNETGRCSKKKKKLKKWGRLLLTSHLPMYIKMQIQDKMDKMQEQRIALCSGSNLRHSLICMRDSSASPSW